MKQKLSLLFLYYLRFFARLQLKKNPNATIVGITGSAGKTSCLLACEAVLKPSFRVKTNYGGNSESGIPLNILGLKTSDFSFFDWAKIALLAPLKLLTNWEKYDIYLVEMGIDSAASPKNMSHLLSILQPKIGIFLNVSSVHAMNFRNIDQIASEKAKLVNSVNTAIINASDPLVKKYTSNSNIIEIVPQNIKIPGYVLPEIFSVTLSAALTLGQTLGLSHKSSIINLKSNFYLAPGRSSYFKGINNSHIIDSSYNSSPLATAEMLKLLSTFKNPRIAVLGDMRELGSESIKQHQQIYHLASKICHLIISVGPETQKYFGPKAIKFLYWWQAADYLKKNLPPRSTILVKGSQNTIYLEELVKELLADKNDVPKLCRQSPYWLKIKSSFIESNHN